MCKCTIVVRGEKSAAGVLSGVKHIIQTCLSKTQNEGGKLGGEEVDDLEHARWRDDDAVDAVDDAVSAEDVDGDDAAVEVDGQAT